MKILIVLPDNNYFLWQMLVQMNNFKNLKIDGDVVYIIGKRNLQCSLNLKNIIKHNNTNCSFFVFNDERYSPQYSSSLRPHLLTKFFEKYPEGKYETFFYIDPDVIFTKKIKSSDLEDNDVWYLSDTKSYINSKYIKSKSEKLFHEMCDIVKINPEIVENNDDSAGGAQYILKNVDADFWRKVELDSESLFKHMINTSYRYSPENPIQAWTADMWAVLWNAWYFEHETKIIKRLNFSWATDQIKKWNECSIYHNAGAVLDNDEYFLKTKYQVSPFNKDIKCSDKYCSFMYLKEIKDTEKNLSKLIF